MFSVVLRQKCMCRRHIQPCKHHWIPMKSLLFHTFFHIFPYSPIFFWLVVYLPLWKTWVSWDHDIPHIWWESHNPNVPNHQPDPMVFLWFYGFPMVFLWFSMFQTANFDSPKPSKLLSFSISVSLLPLPSKSSSSISSSSTGLRSRVLVMVLVLVTWHGWLLGYNLGPPVDS